MPKKAKPKRGARRPGEKAPAAAVRPGGRGRPGTQRLLNPSAERRPRNGAPPLPNGSRGAFAPVSRFFPRKRHSPADGEREPELRPRQGGLQGADREGHRRRHAHHGLEHRHQRQDLTSPSRRQVARPASARGNRGRRQAALGSRDRRRARDAQRRQGRLGPLAQAAACGARESEGRLTRDFFLGWQTWGESLARLSLSG